MYKSRKECVDDVVQKVHFINQYLGSIGPFNQLFDSVKRSIPYLDKKEMGLNYVLGDLHEFVHVMYMDYMLGEEVHVTFPYETENKEIGLRKYVARKFLGEIKEGSIETIGPNKHYTKFRF